MTGCVKEATSVVNRKYSESIDLSFINAKDASSNDALISLSWAFQFSHKAVKKLMIIVVLTCLEKALSSW